MDDPPVSRYSYCPFIHYDTTGTVSYTHLIHKILQNSPSAVVGNEKMIDENKDLFDEVMKLQS